MFEFNYAQLVFMFVLPLTLPSVAFQPSSDLADLSELGEWQGGGVAERPSDDSQAT